MAEATTINTIKRHSQASILYTLLLHGTCVPGNEFHLLRAGLTQLLEQWENPKKAIRPSLPPLLLDMEGVAAVDSAGDSEEES